MPASHVPLTATLRIRHFRPLARLLDWLDARCADAASRRMQALERVPAGADPQWDEFVAAHNLKRHP